MTLKIINTILILIAIFMGLKQGYAMASGKPEMLDLFSKWGFSKNAVAINGIITMIAAVMIAFPKTFIWGNFLMAAGILMLICFHMRDKNLNGVMLELPFLALNLIIIYLQYPLPLKATH
ncbi:DoxX family protein [Polluticaenibacter yanchengensis]|uniref:DoxX family protein n=1 Tax=Polluticaenibacter yanchengensis TaxID=3014562 RepID=A0ABT4UJN7_9BACT|nr:DoxX family protein [Chitinophagaceae bacterium LY-5]